MQSRYEMGHLPAVKRTVLLAMLECGEVSPDSPTLASCTVSSWCCGKGVWMQNAPFHVDHSCIPSPKMLQGQREGAEWASPALLPGLGVASVEELGGYFCAGAVQEAPPGEESIHPAAETSSTVIFLVKHKASGREQKAD